MARGPSLKVCINCIYLLNDVSGFQRLVLLLDVILADENVIDK
jgi:hypothetical protein